MSLLLSAEKIHFFDTVRAEGKSEGSLKHYDLSLRRFDQFLRQKEITDLRDVTVKTAEEYFYFIISLTHYRTGEILSTSSQNHMLSGVRLLFRGLYLEEKILTNPFESIIFKKKNKTLPRDILSEEEIERLLESLKLRYGLYGQAIGEILYGTGIRAAELVNLTLKDVNLSDHLLFIREGKGRKDRVLPIPSGAAGVLRLYRRQRKTKKYFFENKSGCMISSNWVRKLLHQGAKDAGVEKRVTPHGIRHTFATHLLQRGMDIRYIQMLLGHEEISTTEIYTKVTNEELKRVYLLSHPRA